MFSNHRWLAVIFILLSIFTTTTPLHAENLGRVVFMDEPLPPYTLGKQGEICKAGITKEIFDELFGRIGIKFDIRLVPWARAIDSATHGDCDGIPMLVKNTERESFLAYTDPVVENREQLYYLPQRLGTIDWQDFDELQDYHIGMVRGYTYSEDFLKTVEKFNIRVTYSKDSKLNFRMLQAGRVDMIIEDETVIKPFLDENPDWAKQTATASQPVSIYNWHIGLSHHSALVERIPDINHALKEMREDGTLKRILDKR